MKQIGHEILWKGRRVLGSNIRDNPDTEWLSGTNQLVQLVCNDDSLAHGRELMLRSKVERTAHSWRLAVTLIASASSVTEYPERSHVAYADGHAPGLIRIKDLGLTAAVCPAPGTSEDVALLLADGKGATLIVAVGTHWTLEEFLDKGRSGMASTFLTQLRVGTKIVNAKGVSRLYRSRISGWALIVLALAAAITILVAVAASPAEPILIRYLDATWHSFVSWLTGLFK